MMCWIRQSGISIPRASSDLGNITTAQLGLGARDSGGADPRASASYFQQTREVRYTLGWMDRDGLWLELLKTAWPLLTIHLIFLKRLVFFRQIAISE